MDSPAFFGINVPAGFMWCGVTAQREGVRDACYCAKASCPSPVDSREGTIVGVDLAKDVYQLAVADRTWQVRETHRMSRAKFEA